MIRYEWLGVEDLANALRKKSETDYRKVERKNILEMRNRAVSSSNPSSGGTPVDTSELRLSASVGGDVFGYTKDYAPHVEFGHRLVGGGYVGGQYYLRSNVNIQQPIFKQDLITEMRK
ncbi:hypothetical protein KQI76_07030 [Amphibacillus sp. MSJ-3]|uniref:hypothetical protein n=1 Tax=Amphibacillus sp. MSJ-3 TaxID=2841505 RepID=UPI001C0EE2A9|nr:hypothetical protein [Amphibacillus sp. MSJ-3]MBU5594914.1 hypothetical protein [Amphibacillus sp. MSJ-3]